MISNLIYLRPLEVSDLKKLIKWRKDQKVWRFTLGRKKSKYLFKDELRWYEKVKKKRLNFAIIFAKSNTYIGNVYLTKITKNKASYEIFIGDKKYWGKGLGTIASKISILYAKLYFKSKELNLKVHKDNISALKMYKKSGFKIVSKLNNNLIFMKLKISTK